MALCAEDLRHATVAILKDWCKDFGIKPSSRKEHIIQQLNAHMITCTHAAAKTAAVGTITALSLVDKEKDFVNVIPSRGLELRHGPVEQRKRCTDAQPDEVLTKRQRNVSLSHASKSFSSASPAGGEEQNSLKDSSHEPSPSGTEGQRVWPLSQPPSSLAPLLPLVGGFVQHQAQHVRVEAPSDVSFGRSQLADAEEDETGIILERERFQQGRSQESMSQTMQKLVSLSVAAAKRDKTAQEPRLVDLRTGMVHSLTNDGVISLGRCRDCEINVPEASGRHCVFFCSGGQVKVEDMGSSGTFINDVQVPVGELLPQHVKLRPGDILALLQVDGPRFLFLEGRKRQKVVNSTTAIIFGGA